MSEKNIDNISVPQIYICILCALFPHSNSIEEKNKQKEQKSNKNDQCSTQQSNWAGLGLLSLEKRRLSTERAA